MPPLPVMLNLAGKRCVILGGGKVALRRAKTMIDAQADVTVIAPSIMTELADLPITQHQRAYEPRDLDDAFLVVIATDDPHVNDQATRDAREADCLINRADKPELGDLTVPAHSHIDPITLAVSTAGISSSAASTIRDQLAEALDPDWHRLLQCAADCRSAVKARHPDPPTRRAALKKLADAEAMTILKHQGEAALKTHYESL